MGKGWSVLFGAVLLACFLSLVIAPFVGWWLPKNVASFGGEIDFLFYVILFLTGFFFILTEVILVYVMWKYAYDPNRKAEYVHGNHRLEVFWTVVPAGILLYVAFAQIPTWAHMKSAEPTSWFIYGAYKIDNKSPDMVVQVTARQWEWRMRYGDPGDGKTTNLTPTNPREWADNPEADDLHDVNSLHTWKDANIRVYLKTLDVIHSFFLPNLRLKQDALPGRTIAIWFKPIEANCTFDEATNETIPLDAPNWRDSKNEWEITCAELCGPRHYAMRGRFYVHKDRDDYLKWLNHAKKLQNSKMPEKRAAVEAKDK